MRKITCNKYADFYLNAAQKLRLGYKVLNKKAVFAKIFDDKKELFVNSNSLSVNSQVAARLANNKKRTSLILIAKKFPVPSFQTFKDKSKAISYAYNLVRNGTPIVIKPVSGSLAIGVTVKPNTKAEIIEAVDEAFLGYREIMVENFVSGENYRVTVFQGQVIAVTWRRPAYVIGTGKDSVKTLISRKNQQRHKIGLPPITLRKKDIHYLTAQKIDLYKTLNKDKCLQLQLGCDLEIGGERVRVDIHKIPQKNIDLFVKATKTLTLEFAGIDFIITDIKTPYSGTECAINEINSAPQLDVHYLDQNPSSNYAAERILRKYFFGQSDVSDQLIKLPVVMLRENLATQSEVH
ncbi:MAG: hypothetical protein ACOX6V_04460 [Patescibacteria group bacterium]|jgi:cyanophycin synthetase